MNKKLLLISLLAIPFSLIAEEKAVEDTKKEEGIEVFVTGSRSEEQSPLNIPQATNVVTREQLSDREQIDLDNALRELPNFGMSPTEGNPNYWQEGFTIRGLGAQRVLTLSDGIRQTGQGIGYGGGNLSLYDTFGIDRIEVLRGPSSVLYGTDAFGGVVNIITREPTRRSEFGKDGGVRYGFDGQRDGNKIGTFIDVGDKEYGLLLSGSIYNSGRPNLPDGEDPKSGSYRGFGLNGKFDYYLDNTSKIRILGNINDNRDILVTDDTITLPIATFGAPGSSELISSPLYFTLPMYQRSLAGVEYEEKDFSDSIDLLKTGLYWQRISREFHRESSFYPTFSPGFSGPPTFVDPSASVTRSVVDTDDTTDTFEWQTIGKFKSCCGHNVTAGLDVAYDTTEQPEVETQQVLAQAGLGSVMRPIGAETSRIRADADQLRVGTFVQDSWDLAPWELVPGARFDYVGVDDNNSDFDDDVYGFSGTLGNIYHFNKQQQAYLNLSTGFRAPDLGERFQDGIVNLGVPSRVIGKNDLDPERSWSAELGTKHRLGDVTFDFATFGNLIDDYIGRVPVAESREPLEQFANRGSIWLYGGEASVKYNASEQWQLYSNLGRTWTDSEEKIDVADWALNYGTSYTIPVNSDYIKSVTPAVHARTVLKSEDKTPSSLGNRDEFNGSSFTVVDLVAHLDLGKTTFGDGRLSGGVKNLFDREYKEPFFVITQPERSGFFALELTF